ncbi:unannotated protein [freshwater metagenome]|uniref:Unannotated protein n=1 Tax=freshwater metagenome TaxID=449393 RepID=A0A6J6Y643_9ZZZZ
MVVQADGKILVGGKFRGSIKRLNPNGSIDSTFTPPNPPKLTGRVNSVVVQADGKILVGGDFNGSIKRLNNAVPQSGTSGAIVGGGSGSGVWIIVIVAAGAAVIAAGVSVVRRRKPRAA